MAPKILYIFLLRAEVCTTFEPIVVETSALNTKIYKIFRAIYFLYFTTFRDDANFAILLTDEIITVKKLLCKLPPKLLQNKGFPPPFCFEFAICGLSLIQHL